METNPTDASGTSKAVNIETPTKEQYDEAVRRWKGAQAKLTPVQQELAQTKAELAAAKQTPSFAQSIDPAKAAELDTLKTEDPEKWRSELNKLEQDFQQNVQQTVSAQARKEIEQAALNEFFASNKDITPDALDKGITKADEKEYENGKITMDELLTRAKNRLDTATIKQSNPGERPNIGDTPGTSSPTTPEDNETPWEQQLI